MRVAYWIVTGLLELFLLGTGFMDMSHNAQMSAGIRSLGYPEYFLIIDGTAKLLAAVGIAAPRLPALGERSSTPREWAYAGLTFLTVGATWSHLANHQSPAAPVVVLALASASRWLWRRTNAEDSTRGIDGPRAST